MGTAQAQDELACKLQLFPERDVLSRLACVLFPPVINVKLSTLGTIRVTSVVLTKWGKRVVTAP